jgi:hypothetical protein
MDIAMPYTVRLKGKGERGQVKGERGKVSNTSFRELQKINYSTSSP